MGDDDELYCVACNKAMRNEKAFTTHRKQKKHIENVERLREELLKDDLINTDELESDGNASEDTSPGDNLLTNCNEIDPENRTSSELQNVTDIDEVQKQDDTSKPKQKTRRKKGGNKKTARSTDINKDLGCVVCKQEFPSKNKLFNHLKLSGHSVALS